MEKIMKTTWLGAIICFGDYLLYSIFTFLVGNSERTFTGFIGMMVLVIVSAYIIGRLCLWALRKIFNHVEIG